MKIKYSHVAEENVLSDTIPNYKVTLEGESLTPKQAVIKFVQGDISAFAKAANCVYQEVSEYGIVSEPRFADKLDALDTLRRTTGLIEQERNKLASVSQEKQLASEMQAVDANLSNNNPSE